MTPVRYVDVRFVLASYYVHIKIDIDIDIRYETLRLSFGVLTRDEPRCRP